MGGKNLAGGSWRARAVLDTPITIELSDGTKEAHKRAFSHDDYQRRRSPECAKVLDDRQGRRRWRTVREASLGVGSGRASTFRTEGGPEPVNSDRQRIAGDSAPNQFFVRLSNGQPLTPRLAYFRHSCFRFHCRILAKASRAEAVIESGERKLFMRIAERSDANIPPAGI